VSAVPAHSLHALAKLLGLELNGVPDISITGLATLERAGPSQISFYSNKRFHQALARTSAAAVILRREDADVCPVPVLVAANPYAAYARLSQLFAPKPAGSPGVHASAVVDASAQIAADASIGPHVVIGAGTIVGARTRIGANSVIGRSCVIGEDSQLMANVTFYDGVRVGNRVLVHSAAVVGGDGFGFATEGEGHHKIAQLGGVAIGDDVEIGAGTTIDRGALDDTVIEAGVKIDNQVQIAHNVRVGANTIICGCSAIAGSSVIGKNCIIAGAVGVINHVSICDKVTVTAMSLVNQSITEPGVYSSGTGLSDTASWRKNIVRFKQLDVLWKRLQSLEKEPGKSVERKVEHKKVEPRKKKPVKTGSSGHATKAKANKPKNSKAKK
jgi:UDP-3-O-[3-hydroxymyristoyl] glucosamine N-acyltransferase